MKNIHILPTDNKPSRLYFNINDKEFQICEIEKPSTILKPNRHIYITCDEEIKEGDWFITKGEVFKCTLVTEFIWRNNFDKFPSIKIDCKKIILTTDQDLIKDGVQAINDEFLEWFVKNPSCEEVKILRCPIEGTYTLDIPKEEKTKCYCGHTTTCDCSPEELEILETPMPIYKQETLEEVAENIFRKHSNNTSLSEGHYEYMMDKEDFKEASLEITKWQQEKDNKELAMWKLAVEKQEARCTALRSVISDLQKRSYSEEDMRTAWNSSEQNMRFNFSSSLYKNITFEQWFEQFKKEIRYERSRNRSHNL